MKTTDKIFTLEGKILNSFWFISKEGQSYKNCTINSEFVFPYARKCLYRDKLVDKRVIIAPNPKEVRK
jgi:competence protein ComEC